MKILTGGTELFHADRRTEERTDRETDRQVTRLVVFFFSQICESAKKWFLQNWPEGFGLDPPTSLKLAVSGAEQVTAVTKPQDFFKNGLFLKHWVFCQLLQDSSIDVRFNVRVLRISVQHCLGPALNNLNFSSPSSELHFEMPSACTT
jgi:hypothetical protein